MKSEDEFLPQAPMDYPMNRNILWFLPLATVLLSQTMFSEEPKPELSLLEQWNAVPIPDETPFSAKPKLETQYLNSYRDGFSWANGLHAVCPTNPSDQNLHAIRGWVEGWQAGVKAGGTAPLPAKYAAYLQWKDHS